MACVYSRQFANEGNKKDFDEIIETYFQNKANISVRKQYTPLDISRNTKPDWSKLEPSNQKKRKGLGVLKHELHVNAISFNTIHMPILDFNGICNGNIYELVATQPFDLPSLGHLAAVWLIDTYAPQGTLYKDKDKYRIKGCGKTGRDCDAVAEYCRKLMVDNNIDAIIEPKSRDSRNREVIICNKDTVTEI